MSSHYSHDNQGISNSILDEIDGSNWKVNVMRLHPKMPHPKYSSNMKSYTDLDQYSANMSIDSTFGLKSHVPYVDGHMNPYVNACLTPASSYQHINCNSDAWDKSSIPYISSAASASLNPLLNLDLNIEASGSRCQSVPSPSSVPSNAMLYQNQRIPINQGQDKLSPHMVMHLMKNKESPSISFNQYCYPNLPHSTITTQTFNNNSMCKHNQQSTTPSQISTHDNRQLSSHQIQNINNLMPIDRNAPNMDRIMQLYSSELLQGDDDKPCTILPETMSAIEKVFSIDVKRNPISPSIRNEASTTRFTKVEKSEEKHTSSLHERKENSSNSRRNASFMSLMMSINQDKDLTTQIVSPNVLLTNSCLPHNGNHNKRKLSPKHEPSVTSTKHIRKVEESQTINSNVNLRSDYDLKKLFQTGRCKHYSKSNPVVVTTSRSPSNKLKIVPSKQRKRRSRKDEIPTMRQTQRTNTTDTNSLIRNAQSNQYVINPYGTLRKHPAPNHTITLFSRRLYRKYEIQCLYKNLLEERNKIKQRELKKRTSINSRKSGYQNDLNSQISRDSGKNQSESAKEEHEIEVNSKIQHEIDKKVVHIVRKETKRASMKGKKRDELKSSPRNESQKEIVSTIKKDVLNHSINEKPVDEFQSKSRNLPIKGVIQPIRQEPHVKSENEIILKQKKSFPMDHKKSLNIPMKNQQSQESLKLYFQNERVNEVVKVIRRDKSPIKDIGKEKDREKKTRTR